jgi:hypothetical protein
MKAYTYLADVIAAFHVALASFVAVGQLLIFIGLARKWRWIRNLWFRLAHLFTITVVALLDICGLRCPLTVWEDDLRRLAGQTIKDSSFVGRHMHNLLAYDFDLWVFSVGYVAVALLVHITFIFAPPRRRAPPGEKRAC